MGQSILVLLRHGESVWNQKNLFTGWVDIPLSSRGIQEAIEAGHSMDCVDFSAIFTSTLIRAQMTACLAMSVHSHQKVPVFEHTDPEAKKSANIISQQAKDQLIPVFVSWHLNERKYGDLQGMNKDDARKQFGKEQVHIWRRSFDVPPPNGESLEMTMKRTLPYFQETIVPRLAKGENILISAHGNSLRSIVFAIQQMSKEEILDFEIPTGKPLCYRFNNGNFIPQNLSDLNR